MSLPYMSHQVTNIYENTSNESNNLSSWNSQQQIPICHVNSEIKENIYKLCDKLWHKQILEASKGNKGNVSINSKPDRPPSTSDPPGFARYHCPGGRAFSQLSLPGCWGFELENFLQFSKKNAGTSRFVSKKPGAA